MLDVFRESAKSWGIRLLIWFVALTFVGAAFLVWGKGDAQRVDIVAKVGDILITQSSLNEKTRQTEEMFRRQFSGQMNPETLKTLNAPAVAMDALIENAVQVRQARQTGLFVSDLEISDAVKSLKEFQVAGAFDYDRYIELLRLNGLTPKKFENNLRLDILVGKLKALVERTVRVSDMEVADQYLNENQPVIVSYVKVDPTKLESKVTFTQEELLNWFKSRKAEFELPESRSINVIKTLPERFKEDAKPSEEELRTYFRDHEESFTKKEKVEARHILAQVPLDAPKEKSEEALKKVEAALARIRAGEDFAAVARDMSDGPTAENGGSLGVFGKGQMVPEFEDVAFRLEPGEISEPFKTQFGWHIVQTLSHDKGGAMSYEEAKDMVVALVRDSKTLSMAREHINKITQSTPADKFSELAETDDTLEFNRYEVTRERPIEGVREWKAIAGAAFDLEIGEKSEALELADGFVIVSPYAVTKAHTPPIDQIRNKVEARYRVERSYELARQLSHKIEEAVKTGGQDLVTAASAEGYQTAETKPYTLMDIRKPGAELSDGMVLDALNMDVGEIRTLPGKKNFLVILVKSRPEADLAGAKDALAKIRREMTRAKRSRAYSQFVLALKKRAEDEGKIQILADQGKYF